MKEAIAASECIINISISELNRLKLHESELIDNVKQQLETIKNSFTNSYIECTYKIDENMNK